jgi:hypothetical protein
LAQYSSTLGTKYNSSCMAEHRRDLKATWTLHIHEELLGC